MQTIEPRHEIELRGSEHAREIAARLLALMRAVGRFHALTSPIRVPLPAIAEHFARVDERSDPDAWATTIREVVQLNPEVFLLEEQGETTYVVTTRAGRIPPHMPDVDRAHMLPKRFQDPPPPAPRIAPRRIPTVEVQAEEPAIVREPIEEGLVAEAAADVPVPAGAHAAVESTVVEIADVSQLDDVQLAEIVVAELASSPEVIGFGDQWMLDEDVPRLSKGDLRRLREYIEERGQPLSDVELVEVVLGVRRTAPEFEFRKFALNARLAFEADFEFVGVPGYYLWSVKGLTIASTKRRAAEIGQDYRFLLGEIEQVTPLSEQLADHVLTFYEHYLGVLPYNAVFAAVLPPRVLADQRLAVLTFDSPQTNETFLVELRYPTGNRGGYLAGLDRFFQESLVPGALITVERTDEPGRYTIDYLRVSGQERRLLVLDEKKGEYVFRPVTYYCAVQESMLLTENRFPRLAGAKPLEERVRRYPELVLAATFERVGDQIGTPDAPRYMALIDDLVAAANVERPMTAELIRQIAASPEYPQFSVDPESEDMLYYAPTP